MELSPSVRERIFSAADALYDEAGRQAFPTVDAVRKFAKVNMNDASTGMKVWRRSQSAQIAPMAVQVPGALQQSSIAALGALWSEALALANETLRAAQAGWDAERTEAETLREQMANAYEAQVTELETAQAEVARLRADNERIHGEMEGIQRRVDDTQREIAVARAAVKREEARSIEIERRAGDLRAELDLAHSSLDAATGELASLRLAHRDEISGLRAELTQVRQKAEVQDATARSELATALGEAATLRGKLDALNELHQPSATGRRQKKKADGEAKI